MDDLISRQAVLETLDDMDNVLDEDRTIENYKELLKECYEVLPSVNPQPKTGHWISMWTEKQIHTKDGIVSESVKCSECDEWLTASDEYDCYGRYCPNCGARMAEPQESEEV